jgi:alkaline phosphatase D
MPLEAFMGRRAAAYQAYYEFMPLRRSSMPVGPAMRLFRRVPFGGLAQFHVLDTRQYRSVPPCGSGRKPRCDQAVSPTQQMLGPEQEQWLMEGLRRSSARWNILANQIMMAQEAREGAGSQAFLMDKWDGYVVERQRLFDFLAEARPSNPIVITGDLHTSWVADLKLDFANPASAVVGTELVGSSLSSGGDGNDSTGEQDLGPNPHIKFFNNRRGYVRCTVTRSALTSDFRTLAYVTRPGAPIRTRASFIVENGRPGVQPLSGIHPGD